MNHIKDDVPNRKHLVFCYASPLTKPRSAPTKNKAPAKINFQSEFEYIQNSLKETGKNVRYFRRVATYTNFGDMLASNPFAIHFSGHGVKAHEELSKNGQNGDYLIIEDEYCGGYEMNCNMLKTLLEKGR